MVTDYGGLRAEPPAGSRGRDFVRGSGAKPHEAESFEAFPHLNCRKQFFAVRVINAWNSSSNEIVSTDRLSLFKSRLKQVDLSKFMVGKP